MKFVLHHTVSNSFGYVNHGFRFSSRIQKYVVCNKVSASSKLESEASILALSIVPDKLIFSCS